LLEKPPFREGRMSRDRTSLAFLSDRPPLVACRMRL
jgi:hypothetical protein